MAVNPGVWGIDIGQCALKALRLELVNGVVTATAFDYVEHPKILSQPDANPDELTREALQKFLARNPTKGDIVAMSVPGQSGLARFVKLPPVEEKKIVDIVKFEAKQQIPFPLEEVVWDYQKVSEGTVTDGFAMDTEIGLFAMKRDMINRYIGHFQSVKLEVHHVQMAPLALANYITFDLLKKGGIDGVPETGPVVGKKKCVVALDVGTDGSNLIITDGGRIIWQRPIPVGGNHFTRALTKELKLTFAKAEHLKRNAAKSPELANILKALKPVLQEFVGEVQRSLGYFTNTHRDAQVEYMVGLGSAFRLPGLQKYLADKLSLDVRKPTKFERIAGEAVTAAPAFVENLLSFPVAYGLAAQALGVARLRTNLLPPEISFERKIRAKKPYAVAAAASLLLGTTVLAYGYSVPFADATDERIKKAAGTAKSVQADAKKVDTDITNKQAEIAATQIQVESIIAGQMERANWAAVNRFAYECLPIPGPGGNMLTPYLEPLWNTEPGKRSVDKYRQRVAKGIDPVPLVGDDDLREHLATVDIESVYSRFTTNLKGAYENLERRHKDEIGGKRSFRGSELAPDDWWEKKEGQAHPPADGVPEQLKPEGEGWVVEVRGSTYWHPTEGSQTQDFIRDTLLRAIIERGHTYGDEEKKKYEADPIKGKVSHAFIYNVWEDKSPSSQTFKFIGNSLIDPLIPAPGADAAGAAAAPAGMGMILSGPMSGSGKSFGAPGGVGGGGGGGSNGWVPLTGSGGSGGGIGAGGFGGSAPMFGGAKMPGMPGAPGAGTSGGGPGGMGAIFSGPMAGGTFPGAAGGNSPAAPVDSGTSGRLKVKPRYEFVIVFTWREPTPSDKLRQIKIAEKPAATGGGMFGGASPMPGGATSPMPGAGGTKGGGNNDS